MAIETHQYITVFFLNNRHSNVQQNCISVRRSKHPFHVILDGNPERSLIFVHELKHVFDKTFYVPF